MAKTFELKGGIVVIILVLLTGIVGSMFIVLGPKATERSPGVVHIGVRYLDEMSLAFNKYGKNGPGAKIELIDANGAIAYFFEPLQIGRNLMPLQGLEDGPYTIRLSAEGYVTVELPTIVEGRMLNPPKDAKFPKGIHSDYNMVGVRFMPVEGEQE